MLTIDWHKALSLFLWITPHVLLGVLAVILGRRRLYREFPVFFAYVLYEVLEFVVLFTLYWLRGAGKMYACAYCVTLLLSIALRFGVIGELSESLFRQSRTLKVAARRTQHYLAALLLVIGVLLAVFAPGGSGAKWYAGVFVVNRGAAMVQCGLLLALMLVSHFMALSWRRSAFGIALGLGILTSSDLAMFALRAEFARAGAELLNLLITGTYLVSVLIWIGYSLAPELEPASPTVVPNDEVQTWSTEMQRLLGH